MRTTIELDDDHRARLLALAARRGLKGFSVLVQEALDLYLKHPSAESASLCEFKRLRGSISREQADHLRATVSKLRAAWR